MTLVLSVATPAYSLQVSDRLVSREGKPYDPLANKSIVFRANDGLLAFGYTGPAFVKGVPTDSWIANEVSGRSCGRGSISLGEFPVRDVGWTLRGLCQELRANLAFQQFGGEVCAVGWQWSAGRPRAICRNVLWLLDSGSGKLRWRQLVPRHIPERKASFRMTSTGDWPASAKEWRELLQLVGAAGADWRVVEALLIQAIRRASEEKSGTIGAHCMSVLMRPWCYPNALIRFAPKNDHQGTAFGQEVAVAYSPWIVSLDAIHRPSVLVGGLTCEQGTLTYDMRAPPVPASQTLKGAFQAQTQSPTR